MHKKYFSPNVIRFLAVAGFCLLMIFFNPRGLFDPVRGFFLEATYPFQKTFFLMSRTFSGVFGFLGSIGDLKNENERLIRENSRLAADLAQFGDAKKENAMLREQMKLVPRQKFDLEAAFVIGQDPQRMSSWMMIDKGETDGIRKEMAVVANEGILVGKIADTTAHTARVVLLSDSASVINVLDSETDSKGILKGEFGLGIVMDMVSQQDPLNNGDMIITSGLGSSVPRGLLIGKIQEVRLAENKLFQQAIVSPRVKYSDLDIVYVIKN